MSGSGARAAEGAIGLDRSSPLSRRRLAHAVMVFAVAAGPRHVLKVFTEENLLARESEDLAEPFHSSFRHRLLTQVVLARPGHFDGPHLNHGSDVGDRAHPLQKRQ